jgi:hypothetical protein
MCVVYPGFDQAADVVLFDPLIKLPHHDAEGFSRVSADG